ncbi:calcium-binding protein [Lysobacter enzymogenes]|uniref:calcium-binding protein n=1 Tax=Lysobacter enzymogenes TaxID=69 RepID=UPI001A971402|nr:calcium-binding protein [Lysobacter enzymogenes]QQP98285.1 hypothetical protein JHW38_10015 [Lysobacter enzymogenes]
MNANHHALLDTPEQDVLHAAPPAAAVAAPLAGAIAGEGNDIVDGDAGDNVLDGLGGQDFLFGGDGADTLIGGTGNDTLDGGDDDASDVFRFEAGFGQDTIVNRRRGTAGSVDAIEFGAGIAAADVKVRRDYYGLTLTIAGSTDRIRIDGYFAPSLDPASADGLPIDEVRFADGTVWRLADLLAMLVVPTEQDDGLSFGADSDIVNLLGGNDIVYAGDGDDIVLGGAGDDMLVGEDGDDSLAGGNGNDTLYGGKGADLLQGGAGDDMLWDGANDDGSDAGLNSDDRLNGGAGNDYLHGGGGSDTYRFDKGFGNDILQEERTYFDTARNTIEFGAGIKAADLLVRREGMGLLLSLAGSSDTVLIQNYFADYQDDSFQIASVRFADGTVWDEAQLLSRLPGPSESDDVVSGTAGNDTLAGLGGNDLLLGQGGDDVLRGGDGHDTLRGGAGNDRLEGGLGQDALDGGAGDDILDAGEDGGSMYGGTGADLMIGGSGNNHMEGGYDNDSDIFRFGPRFGQSMIFNSSARTDGVVDAIEFGAGISAADVKAMRRGESLILAVPGTGDSIMVYEHFSYGPEHSASHRIDEVRFADGTVWTLADLTAMLLEASAQDDGISLTDGDDSIDALAGNDYVNGYAGDDILLGGAGDDFLYGGDGDDRLVGGDDNDVLTGGAGNNVLLGGNGSDALRGGDDDDRLNGGAGDDVLTGYLGSDTYRFDKGFGNDRIADYDDYGAGDIDTIEFGVGIKAADIAVQRQNAALVLAVAGTGDTVTIDNHFGDYANFQIERVRFADGTIWTAADLLARLPAPGAGDDQWTGGDGNDTIDGLSGHDTLSGRGGDDTLRGGDDTDVLRGESGNDLLQGDSGADTLDGGLGDDSLHGGDGDDTLVGNLGNDVLDGGAGNDQLVGDTGMDVYCFDVGFGNDTIYDYFPMMYRDFEKNAIEFGAGISAADIEVRQVGQDLLLAMVGSTDTVTVTGQFGDWDYGMGSTVFGVDAVRFEDGTVWNRADIFARLPGSSGIAEASGLVQAMAESGGAALAASPSLAQVCGNNAFTILPV